MLGNKTVTAVVIDQVRELLLELSPDEITVTAGRIACRNSYETSSLP